MPAPLYVETRIDAPLALLWARTQQPHDHVRWDLRFTEITPVGWDSIGRHEFRYATRLLRFTVAGTGVHAGERHRPDGSCTSALRFASDHPLSLIAEGSGYWRYQSAVGGIRFLTGYDYRPRWGRAGRLVDAAVFRPLMGWATAWSFDRLRLWLETGVPPERSRNRALAEVVGRLLLVGLACLVHPLAGLAVLATVVVLPPPATVPAARRCRRTPASAERAPRVATVLEAAR